MTSRQRPHLADIQEDETADLGPVPATEKLIVAVRIRPLKSDEGERILHLLDDKSVLLDDEGEANKQDVLRQKRTGGKQYIYDFTFGENSTQEEVYEATTRGLVRDVLLGYNATVFAYGATGAGKTHTMVGTNASPGIMVRALNDLFNSIQPHGNQYQVSMSYLELYNENIRDLLNPSSGFLDLREDSHNSGRNVTVAGLTEVSTTSTQEVLSLLLRGNRERSVEPTGANKTSSRSHALLSVTVKRTTENKTSQAKLYMLDLAGSERASNTKNRGKRLVEGGHINRSLLALGNVINALSGSGRGGRYVNYRDSKLTRLLRQALSGNCRTVMVAHVSPASSHRDETRNTLVYAARANGITHKVEKNEMDVQFHVTQYRNIISDLRNEIGRLKEKIAEERPSSAEVRARATGTPVKQLREQIIATFREQMKLRRRLMDIDGHLLSLGVEAERQHQIISQWESRRGQLYSRGRSSSSRPNTQASQSDHGWLDGGELNVHQAWSELSYIEREQERYIALRSQTIRELDNCRQRAVALENELPGKLDSDTEREMLSLLIRVHELEADKVALQGERLVESHELRRRGDMLQRLQRQQRLTDDIITRQRHLMEENKIMLPPDLQDLYQLYQQEIHATTFSSESSLPSSLDQLPPIREGDSLFDRGGPVRPTSVLERIGTDTDNNRSSSGGSSSSEWDVTLPPLHQNSAIVMANIENNNSSTRTNGASTRIRPSTMETSSVLFPPIVTQRNI